MADSMGTHKDNYDIFGDFEIESLPNGCKIVGYHGNFGDLDIPTEYYGKPIIHIEDNVFKFKNLTSVVIPNSVTSIGEGAFLYNVLSNVVIPDSVINIRDGSFSNNQLKSLVIPNSVTSIGRGAFSNNQLKSLVIPDSVTNIGRGAFSNNQLKSLVIPNSVTSILEGAFSHNQLKNVVIPDSVTNIGRGAFLYNWLSDVVIPDSVTNIGRCTFSHNVFENESDIKLGNGFKRYIIFDEKNGTINGTISNIVKNLNIPSNIEGIPVTAIGEGAFSDDHLTSVIIPDSVKIIGEGAFSHNRLTNLIIPDSVTSIGRGAFSYNQLESVVIPNSVTRIGVLAFHNNELSDIILPESITSIENMTFSDNPIKTVVIPKSVINIEDGAFTTMPMSSENSIKFEIKSMPYTYAETYARINCMPYTGITPLEELQIYESNLKNCEKYVSYQFAEKTDYDTALEWYNLARNEQDYSKKYEYCKEALIIYLELLNSNPSDIDVLYNAGVVYYALQEYAKCRAILLKLLKINNTHEKALQLRLLCEQAIELFKVEHK